LQEMGTGRGGDWPCNGGRNAARETERDGIRGNTEPSAGGRGSEIRPPADAAPAFCAARWTGCRPPGLGPGFTNTTRLGRRLFETLDLSAIRPAGADQYRGWAGR